MQKGNVCILICGMDNVSGHHALELKEAFKLEIYPNQKIGEDYFYILFHNNLNKRTGELSPNGFFSEFMIYLGLRGYVFRLDRAHIHDDNSVDYVIKITRMSYISMPQNLDRK
ncbi:MAG: hypothetical protein QQN63_02770 [Nitrosopumilus sp.]